MAMVNTILKLFKTMLEVCLKDTLSPGLIQGKQSSNANQYKSIRNSLGSFPCSAFRLKRG